MAARSSAWGTAAPSAAHFKNVLREDCVFIVLPVTVSFAKNSPSGEDAVTPGPAPVSVEPPCSPRAARSLNLDLLCAATPRLSVSASKNRAPYVQPGCAPALTCRFAKNSPSGEDAVTPGPAPLSVEPPCSPLAPRSLTFDLLCAATPRLSVSASKNRAPYVQPGCAPALTCRFAKNSPSGENAVTPRARAALCRTSVLSAGSPISNL
jgi:hypothetical protein